MKRVCNCCGKEQDRGYDPYYLFNEKILCESCLLKKYPIKKMSYYYSTYDKGYYDSFSEALEWMTDETYTAADGEEES